MALPDKPSVVALIDVDKVLGKSFFLLKSSLLNPGQLDGHPATEVSQEHPVLGRHVLEGRTVRPLRPSDWWDGNAGPADRESLQDAHSQGEESPLCGLTWLGFQQVAEGIFDVLAVFNETNEFVLYYHRFCLEVNPI